MTTMEKVAPDQVILGSGSDVPSDPFADGCPMCGSLRHQAPEGVHDVHTVAKHPGLSVGDAKWQAEHCWKCGFRPGVNVAVSQAALHDAYERLKAQIMDELAKTNQRGLEPPQSVSEIEQLKADLEKSKQDNIDLIAQLRKDPGNQL